MLQDHVSTVCGLYVHVCGSLQSCLIVFFNDGLSTERALSFISDMKKLHVRCRHANE